MGEDGKGYLWKSIPNRNGLIINHTHITCYGYIGTHPLLPIHLLIYAVQTSLTTITCIAEYLSWTHLSVAEKINLGYLYVPYLALCMFIPFFFFFFSLSSRFFWWLGFVVYGWWDGCKVYRYIRERKVITISISRTE